MPAVIRARTMVATVTRVTTALALTIAGSIACTVDRDRADQARPIPIALLSHSSGDAETDGDDAVRGAQLAVALINKSHNDVPLPLSTTTGLPRLGGAELTLLTGDTKGVSATADEQTEALVTRDHAIAVVVSDTADIAAGIGRDSQHLRVPVIDAYSTADFLTEQGMGWYFRIGPTDRTLADTAFALLHAHHRTGQRLTLLVESGTKDATTADTVAALAARDGHKVVKRLPFTSTARESTIRKLTDVVTGGHPDAVLVVSSSPASGAVIDELAGRLGVTVPVIGIGSGFGTLRPAATTSAEMLRTAVWSADLAVRTPAGRAVTTMYERTYNRPMTVTAADAFTAVLTLGVAINTAGSRDPAAIRAALRQTSIPATSTIMPWGGIRFGDNGQNPLAAAVMEVWRPSTFRVVYPAELANRTWTMPEPRWPGRT